MAALPDHLVLIVDPDESLRALFRDLFTLEGYSVDALPELQPGSLREYSPVALVYGLGFGDEAARIDLLRELLADRPADCASIVLTADPAQIAMHQTALASLGIPIVSKPFDIEHLLRIVQADLDGKSSDVIRMDGSALA